MLQDGEQYCFLDDDDVSVWRHLDGAPIRILHGTRDEDFPLERSKVLLERLQSYNANSRLDVVEGGDHRLSDPQQLHMMEQALDEIIASL